MILLISIVLFIEKMPLTTVIGCLFIIILVSSLTIFKILKAGYKIEFNQEIYVKTLLKRIEIKKSEITGLADSKLILETKKIPLWYPVYGKYAIGSRIDNYEEIFTTLKKYNRGIHEVKKPSISGKNWLAAAIIGILTTLLILLTGIIPNGNDASMMVWLGIYFGNVIIIALLFHLFGKKE